MSTLPPARAGIGSAVNDTVRELGGALGVAVIGSIAASRYTSTLQADLTGASSVPDPIAHAATDNIGAALIASRELPDGASDLAALARHAFIDSMTSALWVAVGAAVAATLVVIVWLPHSRNPVARTTSRASDKPRSSARSPSGGSRRFGVLRTVPLCSKANPA